MDGYDEYKVDVGLTPHTLDNKYQPYYWCIFGHGIVCDEWGNVGFGWAETSQKAFEQALSYYNNLIENK